MDAYSNKNGIMKISKFQLGISWLIMIIMIIMKVGDLKTLVL